MNIEEIEKHRLALKEKEKVYDEQMCMTVETVKKDAYHTKLAGKTIHGTRDSLAYATALLYGEAEEYTERALKIIEEILLLQDKNPENETFGLWPYYREETLDEMDAPDWNWADFMGKLLVEILYVHKEKLPEKMVTDIENACRYACESIIKRNVGIQYTNVVFMEALVLVSTGELLNEKVYFERGYERLEKFLGFYHYHGGFFEYNSPCYTPIVVKDVGTFLKLVKNEKAKELAEKINDLCWQMIAEHFRVDMLQLAGPHSRAYSDYINDDFLRNIEDACEGEISFGKDEYTVDRFWTKSYCPEKYRKYFTDKVLPRSSENLIIKGFNYPFFAFCQTATTYHADKFTLGTFNREELWNQRRPLLGYIKGKEKPYCIRVRCLHDGYDFSSAALHCVQEKSSVLGAVNFSSNRGDTHVGLDSAKNAVYEKLELTFEISGDMTDVSYECFGNSAKVNVEGVNIEINIPSAKFGANNIEYKLEKGNDKLVYSMVLYSGEKTKIDLEALESAYVCFVLSINSQIPEVNFAEDGKYIIAECETFGRKLGIKTLKASHTFMEMMYDDLQTKDGQRLEDIAK